MMPGETPPAAATAGIAAVAAATACSNCGALQQNLNEYVAALIALKQKIIDTDHLLTDYQQKCDELQFAARESNTLRRQVEQMLQKLSPLEKCQEELDSVKAELEEKKSSLKLYQDICEEYEKVKEEKDQSERIKKKLEAKVKKLEEAAAKHIQDFKQLKAEKKVLEKELKKVQGKSERFSKAEQKKVLKHAETQSDRETPVTHLDKEKVKLLLEELWMCIDSSTVKSQTNKNDYLLVNHHDNSRTHEKTRAMQNLPKFKKSQGEKLSHSSSETHTTQASLTSEQTKLNSKPTRCGPVKNNTMEMPEDYYHNSTSHEGRSPEVVPTNLAESNMDLFGKEQEELGENLQDVLTWFRSLPPLLSPIQFSPAATPDSLFGNLTDSSDEEMDQDAQMLESILEKHDQPEPTAEMPHKQHSAELHSKSSSVNDTSSNLEVPLERWSELKNEESALHSDPLSAVTRYVSKKDAESKEVGSHLEDNSMETDAIIEVAAHNSENLNKNTVTISKMKDNTSVPDVSNFLVGQEETAESMLLQEAVPFEDMLEESSEERRGKEELTVAVEATTFISTDVDLLPTSKGGLLQQTEESVLTTQNVLVVPKKLEESSSSLIKVLVVEDGCEDTQTQSSLENAESLGEDVGCVTRDEQRTVAERVCVDRHNEPEFTEAKMKSGNCKFVSETVHPHEPIQQQHIAVTLMQAVEEHFDASNTAIKSRCVEDNHGIKENKCELREETELVNIDSSSQSSDFTEAPEKWKNSLDCTDEVIQTGSECSITLSGSTKNLEDDQLETRNETVLDRDKMAEIITVATKSLYKKEECLQLEIGQKDSIKLEQPDCDSDSTLLSQTLIIKESLSFFEVSVQANCVTSESETLTRSFSELDQVTFADTVLEEKSVVPSISNSIQSTEAVAKDECWTSKGLEDEDNESSKSTRIKSTESGESEKSSVSGTILEREIQSCLISENWQCGAPFQETANLTGKRSSFDTTQRAVEGTEMSYECPVTNQILSDLSGKESPAQSTQNVLQAKNAAIVIVGCKSTMEFMESTNPEVTVEHLERNGRASAVASPLSPVPVCIAPSSPNREDTDHGGHLNSGEDLKSQEANTPDLEENQIKSLDCCSSHQNNVEVKIEQVEELSSTSEPQVLVNVEGCCVVGITEVLTPQATSLDNLNTGHISVRSGEELLISPSEKKLRNSSGNSAVEHSLGEASAKKTLSSEGTLEKGEEFETLISGSTLEKVEELKTMEDVEVMDSSTSDSSEESYPLRKVNCTKQLPWFPVFKEEMEIEDSGATVPSSMTVSCDKVLECSLVPEEVSSKDKQTLVLDADMFAVEATAKTLDHTYAATRACSSGNALLNLEASITIETTEERQEQQNISSVVSLTSVALVNNEKFASRRSSASDLEVDIVALNPEHNGASVEISEIHSASDKGELSTKHERAFTASGSSSIKEQDHFTSHQVDSSTNISHNTGSGINSDEKTVIAKTSQDSIPSNSKSSHSNSEQQKVMPEKLESLAALASCTKNGAKQALKSSNGFRFSARGGVKGDHSRLLQRIPRKKEKKKNQQVLLGETIPANADTSTPIKHSSKMLSKIRQEMGPPLPPLLPPLLATPPRSIEPTSPLMSSSSQSSLPSPLDELISPLRVTPVPPRMSPLTVTSRHKSPAVLATWSPSEMAISQRTLSSPLQFCATTPKHALPVPGRLPPSAAGSMAPPVPQENSVKILDSMYPELSPLARTLNILKGNIQLSRSSSLEGENIPRPVHQITGFKAIASKNTAFVKTGTSFKSDLEQPFSSMNKSGKRIIASAAVPRSAKKLRLDKSPKLDLCKEEVSARISDADVSCPADEMPCLSNGSTAQSTDDPDKKLLLRTEKIDQCASKAVNEALEKISQSCFDLLPVIRCHFLVNNTSKVPVMRDEEKDVVFEFGVARKDLAEPLLKAVLTKLKTGKASLGHSHIQALCRVYVGICRQLGDREKARLFCYSLLKEGFPKSDKLFLFIGNVWSEIFFSESVINSAIQLVARQHAKGEVLKYLKTYLNWGESTPADIGAMVSTLLLSLQVCPQMEFQRNEQYGVDLAECTWEYVFAIDLLCSYQKWRWTHDNIISKELWPVMDKWIKNRVGNGNSSSPSDIVVAAVLRLIGRLGQIGLRGGFVSAVESISSVVGTFLQHAKEKDVPWGVQLAAAYALFELGPSNPSGVLEAIRVWEAASTNSLPLAVTSGMAEVSSLLNKQREQYKVPENQTGLPGEKAT